MIEDMTIRKFAPKTQRDYVQRAKNFAAFLGQSPDLASFEDVLRYRLHQAAGGGQRRTADPKSGLSSVPTTASGRRSKPLGRHVAIRRLNVTLLAPQGYKCCLKVRSVVSHKSFGRIWRSADPEPAQNWPPIEKIYSHRQRVELHESDLDVARTGRFVEQLP